MKSAPENIVSVDSLQNFVSNLGNTSKDKSTASFFSQIIIPQEELIAIYRQGGIGGKIIDCVAEDLGRVWRVQSIPDHDVKKLTDFTKALRVKSNIVNLIRWSRLYGGAVIIVDVGNDEPSDELVPNSIAPGRKIVTGLRVHHRWEFSVSKIDSKTGRPSEYLLNATRETFHPSRVLGPVDGITLPVNEIKNNSGWGASILDRVYQSLLAEATAAQGTAAIMHEAKEDVISVSNLSAFLDGGTIQQNFERRWQLFTQMKSLLNVSLIDADTERYETKSNAMSLGGIAPLMQRFANRISAETDIPMTRLYGQLASGLSTSGATNQQDYYDMLGGLREDRIDPLLSKLDELLLRSVYGNVPDGYTYKWEPFREMTDEERARINKDKSEADDKNLANGVIAPAHVTRRLHEEGVYPISTEFVEYMEKRDGLVEGTTPDDMDPDDVDAGGMDPGVDASGAEKVQETALNGAQVSSLVEIAGKVKTGELEPEQALEIIMVSFPTVERTTAQKIVTVKEKKEPPSPPQVQPPLIPPENTDGDQP